jgi:hypothetical protein
MGGRGCSSDLAALACAEGDDPVAMLEALERLGARPAVAHVRRRLFAPEA